MSDVVIVLEWSAPSVTHKLPSNPAKHLRGKTFTVGIENEQLSVTASFNNECLLLVTELRSRHKTLVK